MRPTGRTLTSHWSENSFTMFVYGNILSSNTNNYLIDKHYKTISGSARSECSSCRICDRDSAGKAYIRTERQTELWHLQYDLVQLQYVGVADRQTNRAVVLTTRPPGAAGCWGDRHTDLQTDRQSCGTYNTTSCSCRMLGWVLSLRMAWISRRLLICSTLKTNLMYCKNCK